MSAREHDGEVGPDSTERLQCGRAIEARHREVEHDGHDRIAHLLQPGEGLLAPGRQHDLEPVGLEGPTGDGAYEGIVVGHQHYATRRARSRRARGLRGLDRGVGRRREEELELRAAPGLARHAKRCTVGTRDPEQGRQPQPAPGELGGEERIEGVGEGLLVHPASGIRHCEPDVAPLRELATEQRVVEQLAVGLHDTGGDAERPLLLSDGLGGVREQVHHDLLRLGGIDLHGGKGLGKIVDDRDLGEDRRLDEA
jgi:hypothetical protein